ncbi:MAG TPA: hypothetical protein DEQ34_04830 [Balneolaceae bacterium]|nr:hypothetical protein [Balneolaceae bacterium]
MAEAEYTILLVEDDEAVRESVVELISMYGYDCLQAENGQIGLETAKEETPDIIVSDVMMPVMDGFNFVKEVLKDPEIAHIPIIMLTAKVEEQDMLEGLESGAVDYLTKPFNSKELLFKVRNILKSRDEFKSKNWQNLLSESFVEDTYDEDKEFMKDLYKVVTSKMESSNFGVTELAADLNVSERNLYRKVKELTGEPVAAFIREARLQRAHQLLSGNQVKTKSEAAYKVGFKSPRHFSKAYKKRFG